MSPRSYGLCSQQESWQGGKTCSTGPLKSIQRTTEIPVKATSSECPSTVTAVECQTPETLGLSMEGFTMLPTLAFNRQLSTFKEISYSHQNTLPSTIIHHDATLHRLYRFEPMAFSHQAVGITILSALPWNHSWNCLTLPLQMSSLCTWVPHPQTQTWKKV